MRVTRCIASILWTMAIGALVCVAASTSALAARTDRALERAANGRPQMVDVIVQTPDRPTFEDRTLVGAFGGEAGLPFSSINGFPARVPSPALKGLANNPRFSSLSLDAPMKSFWDRNAVRPPVGAPEAFATYGATGAGVGVAVVDSGVANHEDFSNGVNSSIRGFVDFVGDTDKKLIDPYGHGTHVAGILAGHGSAVDRFSGIAPGSSLYILRVLDGNGRGTVSNVLRALDWIRHNAAAHNIRIVNLSLGHPVFEPYNSDPLCKAVEDLVRRGIVVVAAAGNYGLCDGAECYGGITVPGNSPYAITVGAMNPRGTASRVDDVMARFSSRGPTFVDGIVKPDIVANGVFSVSMTSPGSYFETRYGELEVSSTEYDASVGSGDYFLLSGTSMAAPVVSGIAAMMLQKNPSLTPNLVKAILMYTAEDRGYDIMTQGAGYVNAPGAVEVAESITTNPTSVGDGEYWLTSPLSGSSTIDGQGVLWTGRLLFTTSILTSSSQNPIVGYNFEELWGQGVLWNYMQTVYSYEFDDLDIESSAVYWTGGVSSFSVLWTSWQTQSASDLIYSEGYRWDGKKNR
ncbi:MAG: S8 family peptidase [Acidobacteria bacterium]|nr:S8 family peptidase [Acidobacteriota bacterium]